MVLGRIFLQNEGNFHAAYRSNVVFFPRVYLVFEKEGVSQLSIVAPSELA